MIKKKAENLNRRSGVNVNISFLKCPIEKSSNNTEPQLFVLQISQEFFGREKNNMRRANVITNE